MNALSKNRWLILSLGTAAVYAGLAMRQAFSDPTMIQDDARVYLIWMQRFVDPELFPNDWMAKYFQSVTPWGLGMLYWIGAKVGIEPIVFSKLLPAAISVLLGWYGYRLTVALFPMPMAGFFSSLILLQSCWQRDDIASAVPRSFWAVLLCAFLYYFVKRSWIAIALVVIAMSLLCPLAAVLIALWLGLRGLWGLKTRSIQRSEWIILAIAIATLLPYVFSQSEFAPTVNAAQARLMPEFQPGGRLPFFYPNPIAFWLDRPDSGVQITFDPPVIGLGLLLPLFVRLRVPQLQSLKSDWIVLPQLAGTGVIGFFLAHAMFVKLHFPSRYTTHSWRIAMAIGAGIVIAIGLERIKSLQFRRLISSLIVFVLLLYPHVAWRSFPDTGYAGGDHPGLYDFLKTTPKSSMTAYLGHDGSNLPMLAQRSTLTAQEYAVPFHLGYYLPMRQRTIELINAQYSQSLEPAKQLIQRYNVTHWLLDSDTFAPGYLRSYRWFRLFEPHVSQAIALIKSGQIPAVQKVAGKCTIAKPAGVTVLDAACILQQK